MHFLKTVKTGVTLPIDLVSKVDKFMREMNLRSRSKVISEALRSFINDRSFLVGENKKFVGSIFLIYNHERGETLERLVDIQHNYLNLILSVLHVHLTHDRCLEVLLFRGMKDDVKRLISDIENIVGVDLVRVIAIECEDQEHH